MDYKLRSVPFRTRATPNITPFTYYDGATYLEILERLRKWLAEVLTPAFDDVVEIIDGMIQEALEGVERDLDDMRAEVQAALDSVAETDAELRAYVDLVLQQVINNSIELQDPVMAGLVDDEDSLSRAAIDRLIDADHQSADRASGIFHVDDYDGTTNEMILAAINAAADAGGGIVQFAARRYDITDEIRIPKCSNVTFQGVKGATVIGRSEGAGGNAFVIGENSLSGGYLTAADTLENLVFRGLTFDGGVRNIKELGTGKARHQRSGSHRGDTPLFDWGPGIGQGINIFANKSELVNTDNEDITTDWPVVKNVLVEDCNFYGTSGLPVFFKGVEGPCVVTKCYFERCLDPGFAFCEDARFINNTNMYSMDNGVSASRGCVSATITGNHVEKPWYNGVWIAGFVQAPFMNPTLKTGDAPEMSIVTDNTLIDCTEAGVYGILMKGYSIIANNIIRQVRPYTGETQGVGIIANAPNATPGYGLVISGNQIVGAERGGIIARGFRMMNITNNNIRNAGTRTFPDGSDRNGGVTQNFGYTWGHATLHVDEPNALIFSGNVISDTRGVPVTQAAAYIPAGVGAQVYGNMSVGPTSPIVVRLELPS